MPHGEFFEVALAELVAANPAFQEDTIRLEGSTLNAICHAIAAAAAEGEWQASRAVEALYLDTAQGDDLTRLVADRYAVTRHGATAAVVSLTFSRTGTDEITIDAGTVVATADGIRFATDEAIEWAAADVTDKTVDATAIEAGPEGNVAAATLTTIETSLVDTTVTVTNAATAAGGNSEEPDDALRARVRDVFATAVRGTAEAVRLGALTVERVRTAAVFETLDGAGDPTGGATLVIADEAGNANAALVDEVETAIYDYRPLGIAVEVTAATVTYETIAVTASWDPGAATAANKSALKAAIVARVNKLKPRAVPDGETADIDCELRHAVLHEAAATVLGCKGITPTLPVGTVTPAFGEVIRARVSDVAVS